MNEINEENGVEKFKKWVNDCVETNDWKIEHMAEIMQAPIVLPKGCEKDYKKYKKRLKNYGLIVEEQK